jgi:uncharacterized protein YehS (DUF1456 family)
LRTELKILLKKYYILHSQGQRFDSLYKKFILQLKILYYHKFYAKKEAELKMNNNDVLRKLRYALKLNDQKIIEICKIVKYDITQTYLNSVFKEEDDPGFVELSNNVLGKFLDGLIIQNRGKKENSEFEKINDLALTNNMILRKIKIALEMKDNDMIEMFKLAGIIVSKSELSSFFRQENHRNYKICGDQYLRNFLKGLVLKYRENKTSEI